LTNKSNIKYETGLILLFDILGTQSSWELSKAKIYLKKINSLLDQFEELKHIRNLVFQLKNVKYRIDNIETKPFENDLVLPNIKLDVFNFSDTIIVALYGDELLSNSFFIYLMGSFIIPIFRDAFENEVPIRGTISVGKFIRLNRKNGVLLVGPAINDAAQTYEDSDWIGVTTSPSASLTLEKERKIDQINSKLDAELENTKISLNVYYEKLKKTFVKYDIPKKNRIEKNGWALAWPIVFTKNVESNKKIIEIFDKNLSYITYQNNFKKKDIYFKYKNTKDFFDDLIKKYDITKLTIDEFIKKQQ
jgi:hypothetical protein